jgi:hypothetical protein
MSSQYRPSPFTSHATVVMGESKGEKPRRSPAFRWTLYGLLAFTLIYAVWYFAR